MADLSSLFSSLTDSVSNFLTSPTSNSNPSYLATSSGSIPQEFQTQNWYSIPSSGLYQISVESVDTTEAGLNPIGLFAKSVTSLFGDNGEFTPFDLPITPQEITQTEQFAVAIRPTQGGTVVNHNGNKYKVLVLSGTTGVAPYRGLFGMDKTSGVAIGQPDDLKYRSGYEVFNHLRAYIKSYHEAKSQGGKRAKLRMIFRNFKDWEFLYVEPESFTMKRDANKPLLYYYTIQFKVLGHVSLPAPVFPFLQEIDNVLDHAAKLLNDGRDLAQQAEQLIVSTAGEAINVLNGVRNVILAVKGIQNAKLSLNDVKSQILNNYLSQKDSINLALKMGKLSQSLATNTRQQEANGVNLESTPPDPYAYGTQLQKSANSAQATGVDVKKKALAAIAALGNAVNQVGLDILPAKAQTAVQQDQLNAITSLSRTSISTLQTQVDTLNAKLANAYGVGDSTYNSIFGITNTSAVTTTTSTTDAQFQAVYAMSLISLGLSTLLSSDVLFDSAQQRFNKNDSKSGSQTVGQGIFSFPTPNAGTKTGIVPDNATLEDIALAELGDTSRWTELAELNALKPPYIVNSKDTASKINYTVVTDSYTDPTQIYDLFINYAFIVPNTPAPTGAWAGKQNYLALYVGGNPAVTSSWVFTHPQDEVIAFLTNNETYLQYSEASQAWLSYDGANLVFDGVLRPGDKILIPGESTPPPETQVRGPRDNRWTNGLTNAEKSLAVDLKLNDNMDLDLLPNGDFNVASGYTNGAQAVVLKLLYNKGSLKKFPSIGANLGVGKKIGNLSELRQSIFSSLVQDSRIKTVTNINILQQNGANYITFNVIFQDIADPVPITLPV